MIDELIAYLYQAIEKESKKVQAKMPTAKEGFALEHSLALEIAQFCHEKRVESITPYPERYELDAPTFSGQRHRFDLMVDNTGNYVVMECKRRRGISTKDQILTFGAKLIDYGLGFLQYELSTSIRGLFLSTSDIRDGSATYAIGTGIEPVSPSFPPIEYLLTTLKWDTPLGKKLFEVKKEIVVTWPAIVKTQRRDARSILQSYKDHYALWKESMNLNG